MRKVIGYLVKNGVSYPVHLWRPKNAQHGDYCTDAAIVLARLWA